MLRKISGGFNFNPHNHQSKLDWLVVWNIWLIFPYIGNFIIPIDFHIFQRGGPTTKQQSKLEVSRSARRKDLQTLQHRPISGSTGRLSSSVQKFDLSDSRCRPCCSLKNIRCGLFFGKKDDSSIKGYKIGSFPLFFTFCCFRPLTSSINLP